MSIDLLTLHPHPSLACYHWYHHHSTLSPEIHLSCHTMHDTAPPPPPLITTADTPWLERDRTVFHYQMIGSHVPCNAIYSWYTGHEIYIALSIYDISNISWLHSYFLSWLGFIWLIILGRTDQWKFRGRAGCEAELEIESGTMAGTGAGSEPDIIIDILSTTGYYWVVVLTNYSDNDTHIISIIKYRKWLAEIRHMVLVAFSVIPATDRLQGGAATFIRGAEVSYHL